MSHEQTEQLLKVLTSIRYSMLVIQIAVGFIACLYALRGGPR